MEHGEASAHVALESGVVLLAAALLFVILFRKLGLGATLGYLVAGAVVGPQVLGLAGSGEETLSFGELGIVMLLFVVGLELAPSRLWRLRGAIFGLGLTQVALCGLAVSGVIWLATSYPMAAALAVGLSLGLSSTAQVLPMLQSGGNLRTPVGEKAFSILLFQDLSIIPLVTIVAALSTQGASEGGAATGWTLLPLALAATVGLVLAGRFLLRPLFRLIGRLGEREMFVVASLFAVVASAAIMQSLGLSTALGAFVAGVMLADTPYRHELEADIEPFRSILLGLFFISVGMMLDLQAIAAQPLFVIGMAALLVTTKAALITGIGLLARLPWRGALALGLLLVDRHDDHVVHDSSGAREWVDACDKGALLERPVDQEAAEVIDPARRRFGGVGLAHLDLEVHAAQSSHGRQRCAWSVRITFGGALIDPGVDESDLVVIE